MDAVEHTPRPAPGPVTQQPRRSTRGERRSHTEPKVSVQDSPITDIDSANEGSYDIVDNKDIERVKMTASGVEESQDTEIKVLRAELSRTKEQLHLREAEISQLHRQQSASLAPSEEFHSAHSTPFSSMNTEPSSPVTTAPKGIFSGLLSTLKGTSSAPDRISQLEETVKQKHQRIIDLERRLDQVTSLEPEVERLTMELSKYEQGANQPASKGEEPAVSTSTEPPHVVKLRQEVNELRKSRERCETAEKRMKYFRTQYEQQQKELAEFKIEVKSLNEKLRCFESTAGSIDEQSTGAIEELGDGTLDIASGINKGRSEVKESHKGRQNEGSVHEIVAELQIEKEKREAELLEKDKTILALRKEVENLTKAAYTLRQLQQHSKSQSQQMMGLQDQVRANDVERSELECSVDNMQNYISELEDERMKLSKVNGKLKEDIQHLKKEKAEIVNQLSIVEAKASENALKEERLEQNLNSLQDEMRSLVEENATLKDRVRKFGFLQQEGGMLTAKVAELQKSLQMIQAERNELKTSLETTQAQVLIYEEDFKTERADRVRAFEERNEEGERYKAEIARLEQQLNSHKGNLSGLEDVHQARQKQLMQAMDDLKKAQEEIQAKTSQVKQYKKQHDGLVAQVSTREGELEGLRKQFIVVRQELEKAKKPSKTASKSADTHTRNEKELTRELAKQSEEANKYRMKSKTRKAQFAKLALDYTGVKHEMERVRREVEKLKKERKKLVNEVSISSPVPVTETDVASEMEQLRLRCQELQEENETLTETKNFLYSHLQQLSDEEDWNTAVGSPTHMGAERNISSPEEGDMVSSVTAKSSKKSRTQTVVPVSSEHGHVRAKHQKTQSQLHRDSPLPEHARTAKKNATDYDIQHADYVNQSRIQAMLEASKKPSPVSPQSTSSPAADTSFSLPGPIVQFSGDEQAMIPPQGGVPQSTPAMQGVMEGGKNMREKEEPYTAGGGHLHKPHRGSFGGGGGGGGGGGSRAAQGNGEGGYREAGRKAMGQGVAYGTGNSHQPRGGYGQFESGRPRAQSEGVTQRMRGYAPKNIGRGGRQEGGGGGSRGGGDGRMGYEWDGRVGGQRRGSTPQSHVMRQGDVLNSGPPSLPSGISSSLQRQISPNNQQPTQSDASFTQRQRDVKMKEQRRLGDDILTPGINTEVHDVAQDVTNQQEVGGSQEVTGVPYDPNLTCVTCGKVFRIGEIQLYRSHNATCAGTVV